MKKVPLTRKSSPRRSGLAKRQSRMRTRSKTNSRPWENLEVRHLYMKGFCELADLFPFRSVPQSESGIPRINLKPKWEPAVDAHHIVSCIGGTPRWDIPTNLIALCRPAHEFVERWSADGLVMCLYSKCLIRELDIPELDQITHVSVVGWIENAVLHFAWVEEYRKKLLEKLKCPNPQ